MGHRPQRFVEEMVAVFLPRRG